MKKTKVMAGVLAFTAGMAYQQPASAFAKVLAFESSKKSEKQFPKEFTLVSSGKVRIKKQDGSFSVGHLYLDLVQESFTPDFQNLLNGEMMGSFYFESETEDQTYTDGSRAKTFQTFMGDDGSVLLDQIAKHVQENQYQIYGCNSTKTQCDASAFSLTVSGQNNITLKSHDTNAIESWDEQSQQWVGQYEIHLVKK